MIVNKIKRNSVTLSYEDRLILEYLISKYGKDEILNESFGDVLEKVAAGVLGVYLVCSAIRGMNISNEQKERMIQQVEAVASRTNDVKKEDIAAEAVPVPKDTVKNTVGDDWIKISGDAVVTVYNAVPAQCNNDVQHTASMFRLDLEHPESHRIVALERTFMSKHGIEYGDIIYRKGTHKGKQDGVYQVQDLMNKRFAGMDKVDVLVGNDTKFGGTWKDNKADIYVLKKGVDDKQYRKGMAPQAPKKEV